MDARGKPGGVGGICSGAAVTLIKNPTFAATACVGKSPFRSYQHAEKAAQRLNRRDTTPQAPYKCPCCGEWHVGAVDRSKKGK